MTDRLGQQLGNYRLTQLLGQGSFAKVYLGEHVVLKTMVAIKILHTRLDEEDVTQFQQEACLLAGLRHPYIIRVLDFGLDGQTPYLVMDYAPNGTLRTRHPKGTRLSASIIVDYVKQVAEALQYAHDCKVIHRDIKPENMLIGDDNQILLSDFGIALITQSSREQDIKDVAGTIAYMAPEQIDAHPRPASDQYSLGIVAYEWFCGARPFHGSYAEIAVKHRLTPPPPLREHLSMLPPDIEYVMLKALAKQPEERFASVSAFAVALEQAYQGILPIERLPDLDGSSPSYTPLPLSGTSTPDPMAVTILATQPQQPLNLSIANTTRSDRVTPSPTPMSQTPPAMPVSVKVTEKGKVSRRAFIIGTTSLAATVAIGTGIFVISRQKSLDPKTNQNHQPNPNLLSSETVILKCLGNIEGPRYLDGHTADGTIGLAPFTMPPFTGTSWELNQVPSGLYTLKCLGNIEGPRYLDVHSADRTVGLAPDIDPSTHSGTYWELEQSSGGIYTLKCHGNIEGPRYLDGHAADGTVGLAPASGGTFTGATWRIYKSPPIGFGFGQFLLQKGTPIAQADAATNYVFAVGDYNRDGIPDLYCLKHSNTGTNSLEVHILNAADNYQSFLLHKGTPIAQADAATNYVFALGDYNRDSIPDLYCLKHNNTGTNSLEIHILNGADNYQSFLLETGTPITQADAATNYVFAVGDYNRDGIPDLYCLKHSNTSTNSLEVHILNGADNYRSFLLETGTPIAQADIATNFTFAVGDYNRDGIPDLYCLKHSNTSTDSLEVYILNGADNYRSFLLETGTVFDQPDVAANFAFAVGDYNRDGISDVYSLKRTNTGTNSLEVYILNVAR
jgi:serine/threonine protein kinase